MAENKTQKTELSVEDFINSVDHEGKRKDAFEILNMMKKITGEDPKMWGASIIGFGDLRYKYASGREGDWFKVGFSPRKTKISLYVSGCDVSMHEEMLTRFGKHKAGKGCLYVNKLVDIDVGVLKEMIKKCYDNPNIPH
ncbi:DUF1801 domain-containing protein [Vicingaceae bacterium]|nr:DUF1801 domain-containing protein [Vicingaceae bacterium]